jgi:hypothetical protein
MPHLPPRHLALSPSEAGLHNPLAFRALNTERQCPPRPVGATTAPNGAVYSFLLVYLRDPVLFARTHPTIDVQRAVRAHPTSFVVRPTVHSRHYPDDSG